MRIMISLIMALVLAGQAWSAQWDKALPLTTSSRVDWPTQSQANNTSIDRVLANYRQGMALSYSSATTIAIASGEVVVSNSDGSLRLMMQNTAAGTATFTDLDTGAEAPSTTYYLYAIAATADATTATFKVSASSTAPTGITYYKRLGSFYNDASSNITVGGVSNDNNSYTALFGTSTSKSDNTAYQALTDGYFLAILQTVPSASNGYITVYSDSESSPVTVMGLERTGYGGDGGTCTVPVKKGNYYKGVLTATAGTPTATYYWIPKGN